MAIRTDLLFTMDSGLQVSYVESDTIDAVCAIEDEDSLAADNFIFSDIRHLIGEAGGGTCCYCPRQGNMGAHTLAKLALSLDENRFWLEEYPSCIQPFVSAEFEKTTQTILLLNSRSS